jgi:hypothetical protein
MTSRCEGSLQSLTSAWRMNRDSAGLPLARQQQRKRDHMKWEEP